MTDSSSRRILLLTDGYCDIHTAKTAIQVLRYKSQEVVAVLDREAAGKRCEELFGVGGAIPVVASLQDAPTADTLMIGIAPPGGKIPAAWRPIVLDAIQRGMNVVSGLHDFLNDDPEFYRAAGKNGVRLVDLRRSFEHEVAHRQGIREGCLRIHTVGNDCSCGKMLAAVEVTQGLKQIGVDAKFVATGQTGMLIEGEGCAVDRVISDFVSGAAERLVLANQQHDVILIEGQGSLFHPRYSCVTLGLLHGVMPDGLILCYEMGRKTVYNMAGHPLAPLEKVKEFYEAAAAIMHPCWVIGVAFDSHAFSDAEADAERKRIRNLLALPACDVLRHGPQELVEAVIEFKRKLHK